MPSSLCAEFAMGIISSIVHSVNCKTYAKQSNFRTASDLFPFVNNDTRKSRFVYFFHFHIN